MDFIINQVLALGKVFIETNSKLPRVGEYPNLPLDGLKYSYPLSQVTTLTLKDIDNLHVW